MELSAYVIRRFHQTPVSRFFRRAPIVRTAAEAWWRRSQGQAFWAAFEGLGLPRHEGGLTQINVPAPEQLRALETVAAGDEFSRAMLAWGPTSKWVLLGYQDVYAQVLRHLRGKPIRLLEIGIGINDPQAASGMQNNHLPGASLTAWTRYFDGCEAHGADVDRRALIDTPLYRTHFVDQRDDASLHELIGKVGTPLDFVVDDGLHTPEANARTVAALLPEISSRGILVVEDILEEFGFLWHMLKTRLRSEYRLEYYPAAALRRDPNRESEGGIAVFTRRRLHSSS